MRGGKQKKEREKSLLDEKKIDSTFFFGSGDLFLKESLLESPRSFELFPASSTVSFPGFWLGDPKGEVLLGESWTIEKLKKKKNQINKNFIKK